MANIYFDRLFPPGGGGGGTRLRQGFATLLQGAVRIEVKNTLP
jgi:hypothetical protein